MKDLSIFSSFAAKDKKVKVQGNNAVVYTRVSHSSQEDNTSLESQLKFCNSFADRKDLNVVEYFGGKVESAKTDDRVEFKRMLKFIKQRKNISRIIVYSYERFSRSGVGGAKIAEDLLKQYGVVTLAVTQELDPTTSSGAFQQKIFFLFSQMDNELRRDKTITGMSELLLKGYTPYSIPRGYTNLNKGRSVDQQIVMNDEGKLIRKAFTWKVREQLGNVEIVKRLKALGMNVDLRRLAYIFENPYYCGIIVSKMIPNQVIEGKHEAIISKSIFLKVNEIVEKKRATHPKTHKLNNDNLPLKKFMSCASCDTPMTGYLVKAKGLYYYKCRTAGCKHTASAKKLNSEFGQILEMFQVDECDLPLVKEAVITYFNSFFEEQREENKLIQTKVTSTKKQLQQIKERFALGKIDEDLFTEFSQKYNKELSEIQGKNNINSIESSNLENCLKKVLQFCLKPRLWWELLEIERKIQLQNLLFPNGISLTKENRRVLTNQINLLFVPIAEAVRTLSGNKKGQPINFDQLSFRVTSPGFKPGTS